MTDPKNQQNNSSKQQPGPVDVAKSVAAAMFGVQSEQNRERDFSQGKPSHFIVAGIIMTVLFVLTLVTIVSNVVDK